MPLHLSCFTVISKDISTSRWFVHWTERSATLLWNVSIAPWWWATVLATNRSSIILSSRPRAKLKTQSSLEIKCFQRWLLLFELVSLKLMNILLISLVYKQVETSLTVSQLIRFGSSTHTYWVMSPAWDGSPCILSSIVIFVIAINTCGYSWPRKLHPAFMLI